VLGNPAPPCADRGCSDICSTEGKTHWHNILRGSANPPTSTGESHCIRDRERVTINTCRGGGLHPLYSTHQLSLLLLQLLQWQQGCCHCSSLSLHSLAHTHVLSLIFLSNISLLYRHFMVNMEGPIALKYGMNCGTIHASTCLVVGYCHKWQYPNK